MRFSGWYVDKGHAVDNLNVKPIYWDYQQIIYSSEETLGPKVFSGSSAIRKYLFETCFGFEKVPLLWNEAQKWHGTKPKAWYACEHTTLTNQKYDTNATNNHTLLYFIPATSPFYAIQSQHTASSLNSD